MNPIYLVLFASALAIMFSTIEMSTPLLIVEAQTPPTSDLPSTIGNESTSDMRLTNNTVPFHNTTTTYAAPPL
ncbi:MAG: hypothetical protein M3Y25_05830 [Thermoproteota archaeon]|nr:hypothetical protein [Thermoproteota archaeon]